MNDLRPFADDATSIAIDKLTVENGTDRIAIYGSLELTRDKRGLAKATILKTIIDQAVTLLNSQADLPDHAAANQSPKTGKNPFA